MYKFCVNPHRKSLKSIALIKNTCTRSENHANEYHLKNTYNYRYLAVVSFLNNDIRALFGNV